jgi:hypothetical protein
MTETDWVKQAADHHRAKMARAIFQAFSQAGDERGVCDGPVLAATLREVINQLQESPGVIHCSRLLHIAKVLEEFDFQSPDC